MDLLAHFEAVNTRHFDGFLTAPKLQYNSRLRSSAGRFIPGRRALFREQPPVIEIATYLLEEEKALELVADTMAHEMIHYWLWVRRKPYGHTPEFHAKMNVMGVSRYNPVPRLRPFRYLYRCGACNRDFPAKRKLGPLACAKCCNRFNGGRYDARFKLYLHQQIQD